MEAEKQRAKQLVVGILAHVDSGKTTLSEAMLYRSGTIRKLGRVDHKDAFLDTDALEKARGITIFSKQALLTAGETAITLLDTPWGRLGLCVCFDLRFEELCRVLTLRGARMILAPAAFNMTTGPAHWELLLRQRAVDNQLFTVGTAPAREESGSYVAWGHSMVCEPWGGIVHQCGTGEEVAVTELELSRIDAIRRQLPILSARRTDLYEVR